MTSVLVIASLMEAYHSTKIVTCGVLSAIGLRSEGGETPSVDNLGGLRGMRIRTAMQTAAAVAVMIIALGALPAKAQSHWGSVPEPASVALMGSGLVTMGGIIRRKLKK